MQVFSHHGCFSGYGYHMISPCFICRNNVLQKMLSMTGTSAKYTTASHTSFVQGSWHPACTHFRNSFGCGQCSVHYPGLFSDVSQLKVSALQ